MTSPTRPSPSPITLCGSISHHPATLGAAMHNAGYRALGLSWTYVPFGVVDLDGALRGMRALGVRGLGVSMPFKIEILPMLDAVDPLAARIGAVNTVVNDGGKLTGHNTDASGAADALAEVMELSGARVTLVGGGGAARAVAHGLRARGATIHVVNRTRARAEEIAQSAGGTAGGLEDLNDLSNADAVVNCTAVGMLDRPGSVVPESAIRAGMVVMDIVYKPVHTALVAAAQRRGARAVHGGRMLLHQAFRQFELYTGREAPRAVMEQALEAGIGLSG